MNECSAYVGLDVHKDTIAVAVALPGRGEPVYRGEVKNQRKSVLNRPGFPGAVQYPRMPSPARPGGNRPAAPERRGCSLRAWPCVS